MQTGWRISHTAQRALSFHARALFHLEITCSWSVSSITDTAHLACACQRVGILAGTNSEHSSNRFPTAPVETAMRARTLVRHACPENLSQTRAAATVVLSSLCLRRQRAHRYAASTVLLAPLCSRHSFLLHDCAASNTPATSKAHNHSNTNASETPALAIAPAHRQATWKAHESQCSSSFNETCTRNSTRIASTFNASGCQYAREHMFTWDYVLDGELIGRNADGPSLGSERSSKEWTSSKAKCGL
jgi:hypothetical protein